MLLKNGLLLAALAALQLQAAGAPVSFSINMLTPTIQGIPTGNGGLEFPINQFSGTLAPFGAAQGTVGTDFGSVTFSLPSGDSFAVALTPASLGSFTGTITGGTGIFLDATGSCQFGTQPASGSGDAGTFSITGSGTITAPDLSGGANVTPSSLIFQAAPNDSSPTAPQVLTVSNQSATALSFTASASVSSGPQWVNLSSTSGNVTAGGTAAIQVSANPSGLALGVYEAQINVVYDSVSVTVPVRLIVGNKGAFLQLAQTGLSFASTFGGPQPAAQTVQIANSGVGTLTGLTATTSVTGSGPNWLHAAIAPGFASGEQAEATISVNPGSLPAGLYYGQVAFSLPSAANSPQSISVQMVVNTGPLPTFQPAAAQIQLNGDSNSGVYTIPSPVRVVLTNPGTVPLNFTAALNNLGLPDSLAPWFTFTPPSGTVGAGGTVVLTLNLSDTCTAALATCAGNAWDQCCALLAVTFPQLNYTYTLVTTLIVGGTSSAPTIPPWGTPPPGAPPLPVNKPRAVPGACTPNGLEPWFTSIPLFFQASVGQPVPLEVLIVDNCGNNLNTGTVIATFSSNDPEVSLNPEGNGLWAATWTPRTAGATVHISLQAASADGIIGTRDWPGAVIASSATPLVNVGGVSNAASGAHILAPGAFISIYGANLASGMTEATSTPLPTNLGKAQAFLGGQSLPLQFSGGQQINAVVPYDIAVNSMQQLLVQASDALSQPEPVIIATAAPGVFTQDQSGSGPGAILVQPAGSSKSATNTPSNPAQAGDALLIFCTGLGTVTPKVAAGSVAPSSPPAETDNVVTATVGGKDATVLFSGLAPGFVGLYQVNVTVPSGITAADDVPVVLTEAGSTSAPVTVAIK